jgi:hypothetical protein
MAQPKLSVVQLGISVEKGIPVPRIRGGGRPVKYPVAAMDVGDSFLFPGSTKPNSASAYARVASARYAPKKFTTRKTPDGMRCWRIA